VCALPVYGDCCDFIGADLGAAVAFLGGKLLGQALNAFAGRRG
jgi:hypothetical protein